MSALAELQRAGLIVAANDDRLIVRGPAPTIAAWRGYIRAHKPELLVELRPVRAVVSYDLIDGRGGTLIDPAGPESAVRELHWRFSDRIDWPVLLHAFEARADVADREAATLIRKLMWSAGAQEI